jgi:WD40 repeat protein
MASAGSDSAIYDGLNKCCRSIASIPAEEEEHLFLVGTASIKGDNEVRCVPWACDIALAHMMLQIHLIEVDDDATAVTCKAVFPHSAEVWSLASCPWDAKVFASGSSDADAGTHSATLWAMTANADDASSTGSGNAREHLDELAVLRGHKSRVHCVLWDPHASSADAAQLLTVDDTCARLWNVSAALGASTGAASTLAPIGRVDAAAGSVFGAAAWDPHFGHEILLAQDSCLLWHDTRSTVRADGSGETIRRVDTSAWWTSASSHTTAPV